MNNKFLKLGWLLVMATLLAIVSGCQDDSSLVLEPGSEPEPEVPEVQEPKLNLDDYSVVLSIYDWLNIYTFNYNEPRDSENNRKYFEDRKRIIDGATNGHPYIFTWELDSVNNEYRVVKFEFKSHGYAWINSGFAFLSALREFIYYPNYLDYPFEWPADHYLDVFVVQGSKPLYGHPTELKWGYGDWLSSEFYRLNKDRLKTLVISNTGFSDRYLLEHLDEFTALENVDLSDNEFTGEVPYTMYNTAGNCLLKMTGNKFETIDWRYFTEDVGGVPFLQGNPFDLEKMNPPAGIGQTQRWRDYGRYLGETIYTKILWDY